MSTDRIEAVRQAIERGETPDITSLSELDDPDRTIDLALETPTGRHWLRGLSDLDIALADCLIACESDFRTQRRDNTLACAVQAGSTDALLAHSEALASGPAAASLWTRLAGNPGTLADVATRTIASHNSAAAENTLYLLVLDTMDPFSLGSELRATIARAGLAAAEASIRSLAAEYLFDHDVAALAEPAARLVHDSDERVRGLAWSAGFRAEPDETLEAATGILGDEQVDLQIRRSALAAIGTHLDTHDVVDLLTFFVTHPSEQLALDAGNLLYRLHRHPTIATAALESPHESVREIGQFLLDPYRGSPAAGGSRPGDPTSSDIFAQMLRQTEAPGNDGNPG